MKRPQRQQLPRLLLLLLLGLQAGSGAFGGLGFGSAHGSSRSSSSSSSSSSSRDVAGFAAPHPLASRRGVRAAADNQGQAIVSSSSSSSSSSVNKFVNAPKPCADGCEALGNCNQETGQCECPWGRSGPSCEVEQLSHCYSNPNNKTTPSCGLWAPKSCACYAQCAHVYCHPSPDHPNFPNNCQHELVQKFGEARCFVHHNKSSDQQHSNIPAQGQADWFRLRHDQPPHKWPPGEPGNKLEQKMEYACWNGWSSWDFMSYVVPLAQCADSCNSRGTCVKNPEKVYCVCRKGFNGTACEGEDAAEACWFAPTCNGHGKCKSGFCHCDKGWWGLGCGRSSAPALAPGSRAVHSRTRLRIYMYELPPSVAFPGEFDDGAFSRDNMYAAYERFLFYFLDDWSVRTENPLEANLFYIPALAFFYVGNVRDPLPHMHRVIHHISTQYPYWNRTKGKDHFWWLTGDQGACPMYNSEGSEALLDHPIKLVHFGFSGRGVEWRHKVDPDYGCLRPKRDVVVPPIAGNAYVLEGRTAKLYGLVGASGGRDGQNRSTLFFFAGGVAMSDRHVSGNARQSLLTFLRGKDFPDVVVKEGRVGNYEEMFLTSKFCIAPYGYGWGLRLPIAVIHGCIPVIIQDHVWQPFEELLPYQDFSVRLQVKDIPSIVDILRSYSDDQIYAMRFNLAKYWKAFVWPQDVGGQAYNYTIEALKRRMHNHASEYYRRDT